MSLPEPCFPRLAWGLRDLAMWWAVPHARHPLAEAPKCSSSALICAGGCGWSMWSLAGEGPAAQPAPLSCREALRGLGFFFFYPGIRSDKFIHPPSLTPTIGCSALGPPALSRMGGALRWKTLISATATSGMPLPPRTGPALSRQLSCEHRRVRGQKAWVTQSWQMRTQDTILPVHGRPAEAASQCHLLLGPSLLEM